MSKSSGPPSSRSKPRATAENKPPGLKEIAAYLKLSPATVSIVLNRAPLASSLSEKTRARVLAAAKHFNYRPNLIARSLIKRESRTIGVIAPESSDGYFTRVMHGLEGALLDAGYLYFTASHLSREDLIREYPAALIQRGVDGLIFVNTPIHEHPGVPSVSISHRSEIEGIVNVLVDQESGMSAALKHLHGLGHRRILFMRGPEWSLDAESRWKATLEAAQHLGLECPTELQITLHATQLTTDIAFRTFAEFLKKPPQFTAICCFNDSAAMGAIRAMADVGLSCPKDISVLGFDDIGTATYFLPRITTVAQPLELMGVKATEWLISRIQKGAEPEHRNIILPVELLVRESTGPASSQ
jgi:DNA-binding LacI/PurR family transcriptional regulator